MCAMDTFFSNGITEWKMVLLAEDSGNNLSKGWEKDFLQET